MERVQRRRAKGWRLPPNTVCVDRSTKWGNPFKVGTHREWTQEYVTKLFSYMLGGYICISCDSPTPDEQIAYRKMVHRDHAELRGKNLACWCKMGSPCHGDVLLNLAHKRLAKRKAA